MKGSKEVKFLVSLVSVLFLLSIFPLISHAAVPLYISYQGKLIEDGSAVTGYRLMQFSLWTSDIGGEAIWYETQTSVQVTEGIYNVELGSYTALPPNLYDYDDLYLQVAVQHPTYGWQTLSPLMPLNSTVFAIKAAKADEAGDADTLDGQDSTDFAESGHDHAFSEITGAATDAQIPNTITIDNATHATTADTATSATSAGDADNADMVDGQHASEFASSSHDHDAAYVNEGQADSIIGPMIADGTVSSSDVGFNYAGGTSKGGAALDLNCTGCVSETELGFSPGEWTDAGIYIYPNDNPNWRIYNAGQNSGLYYGSNSHASPIFVDDSRDGGAGYNEASIGARSMINNDGNPGTAWTRDSANAAIFGYAFWGDPYTAGVAGFSYGEDAHSAAVLGGYSYGGRAIGALHYNINGTDRAAVYGDAGSDKWAGYFVGDTNGVYGEASSSTDVYNYGGNFRANGVNGFGVYTIASGNSGIGVRGMASALGDVQNYGGYFLAQGERGRGVYGWASNASGEYNYGGYFRANGEKGRGVYGEASGNYSMGVFGHTDDGVGVHGTSDSDTGVNGTGGWCGGYFSSPSIAVYGSSSSGYAAGYFLGPVRVTGYLYKSGGGFQIDHPLDPENKYLNHSFVESPDMKNVYDGNVILDENGESWVEFPDYFEALNRDFRYQLTPIGAPGPNLHVAAEISENRFMIAGGNPGMKVSWQVTGIRHDPWANANSMPVEADKPDDERGSYLHPYLYGEDEERGIERIRNPEIVYQMRDETENESGEIEEKE